MKDFKVSAKTIYEGHYKITYRGVTTIKCPFDYVIYQMIIYALRPDLIIEIGSNKGGSALYMADIMGIIGFGIVHAIDIIDDFDKLVKEHPRINTYSNGFQNYNLNEILDYNKILIIEDASHMYKDSLDCLIKFSPIVSVGSYYIVEDGIVDDLGMHKQFKGGPQKAISEFLRQNNNFEIDKHWCNLFGRNATFNVNGYLKRVK